MRKMEDKSLSDYIKDLILALNTLDDKVKNSKYDLRMSEAEECDLLHEIELCEDKNVKRRNYLMKELERVLRQRRVAKNTLEVLQDYIEFRDKQKNLNNELNTLLGKARKKENGLSGKIYRPRVRDDLECSIEKPSMGNNCDCGIVVRGD